MLIEIKSLEEPHSVVVLAEEPFAEAVRPYMPFKSVVKAWKHEAYLPTPAEFEAAPEMLRADVTPGYTYYWPPEKALCLFYGVTHAYTPVARAGLIVDPLQRVAGLAGEYREEGGVEVREHSIAPHLAKIVERLESVGCVAATPLDEGVRVVTAAREVRDLGIRVAAVVYVEEYGAHVEGDVIGYFNNSLSDLTIFRRLEDLVGRYGKGYARLDLTEDGGVAVTAGVGGGVEGIIDAVEDVLSVEEALAHTPFWECV